MMAPRPKPDLDAVFLRSDLLAAGYDDRTIRRNLQAGVWHRVRHGAYFDGPAWETLTAADRHRVLVRAVLLSSKCCCVASHVSAAVELGVPTWDLDLSHVHLTRFDARSGRAEAGVTQHRGHLDPEDTLRLGGVVITAGTRTALDVIRTSPDAEHALVVVNGLLHAGRTTLDDLKAAHAQSLAWPGTQPAHVVLRLAHPGAESAGETRTHHLLWRNGIPLGVPQYEVYDGRGHLVGRVDMAWPEHGLFLEFDGHQKYTRWLQPGEAPLDVVLREKRREERICRITGWRCIRLTWADLEHPEEFLRTLPPRPGGSPYGRLRVGGCSARRTVTWYVKFHVPSDSFTGRPVKPAAGHAPTSPSGSRRAWRARWWCAWRRWPRSGSSRGGPRARGESRPGP
jgi:hypothetical protein